MRKSTRAPKGDDILPDRGQNSVDGLSHVNRYFEEQFLLLPSKNGSPSHFKIPHDELVDGIRRVEVAFDSFSGVRTSFGVDRNKIHIALITKGKFVLVTKGGNEIEIKSGDIILSRISSVSEFRAYSHAAKIFSVDINLIRWDFGLEKIEFPLIILKSIPSSLVMRSYFRAFWDNFHDISPRERLIFIQNFMDLVFCIVEIASSGLSTRYQAELIGRVKKYARGNIEDALLSPGTVAKNFGFSVSYVHRLFKKEGTTFGEWLRNERLTAAREVLLLTGARALTIKQIAYRFGFSDSSHFCRTFKQRFGKTPTQFREETHRAAAARIEP